MLMKMFGLEGEGQYSVEKGRSIGETMSMLIKIFCRKRGRSKQCHSQGTPVAGAAAALFMKILHFFSKLTLGYCTSRPGVCVVGVCIGAVGGLIRTELSVIDGEYGGGHGALFDKVINVCPQEVIF